MWGKEQLLPVVCRDRREIFVGVGDSHGPRGGSEPSRRAHRARGAYVLGEGGVNYVTDAPRGSRSCRTMSAPVVVVGSPGAGATATGRIAAPPSLGVRVALMIVP